MRPWALLGLLLLTAIALIAAVIWIVSRVRPQPVERERRRRSMLGLTGRLGDGVITDFSEDTFYYEYAVGGVTYAASQDLTQIRECLPPEPERLIGAPVSLKYAGNNPANSIVLCEDWSGLRARVSQR